MNNSIALRRLSLIVTAACALLGLAALALVIVVGPERALISHLVEDTAVALAWVTLAAVCVVRARRTAVVLVIAAAWSVSAAAGGFALLSEPPQALAAAWISVWTWAIGVGLAYTLGVLTVARWYSPRVLAWAALLSTVLMAFAFGTLPTVTIEDRISYPNPIAIPASQVLALVGVVSTVVTAFAAIATLALQATSPARRRVVLPVLVAAIVGLVAIGAGAAANEWAPLVQALTVPLLPLSIAATVLGTTRQSLRSVSAQLDGAADPSSALKATLTEINHDLGLAGLAIEVDGETVVAVGRPGEDRVPLLHLARLEGELLTRRPDEDATIEVDRVSPSIAAVLASVRLVDEVHRSRAELAMAREEERRRVRRDLHDEVGPLLSAVIMQTDAAALALDRSPDRSRQSLAKVRAASGDAVVALRRIVRDLHPVAVDNLGLAGAIEELAVRLSGPATVSVTSTAMPSLGAAVEVALYRIAAEAAGNAVRHAAASEIRLVLTAVDGMVVMTVTDDGGGFGPDTAVAGIGLASMRNRAAELSGTLSISSSEAGSTIRVELPIRA